MRDDFLFQLLADVRAQTVEQAAAVPPAGRRTIPSGFNNHLHWQLGHLATITDALSFQFAGGQTRIPESYYDYFNTGTSPADWVGQPPDWEEIMRILRTQPDDVRAAFAGRLQERPAVSDNFLQAAFVGELFQVLLSHESMHAGTVTAMIKRLRAEGSAS